MKKSDVLQILNEQPDEVDIDRLIYTLWLRQKVERAMASSQDDDLPHDEVERLSEAWLASLGPQTR